MRIIFFILATWITVQNGFGQCLPEWQNLTTTEYRKAVENIVVLKNESAIIPFQDFKNLRPVSNAIPQGTVARMLNCYLPVATKNDLAAGSGFNLEIYFVFNENDFPAFEGNNFESSKLVLVLFGEEVKSVFENNKLADKANAVLYHPQKNKAARLVMAQAICGGIGMDSFRKYNVEDKPVRLGYAPPGLVGLDADLLENNIDRIVNHGLEEAAFPGAQVLVARKGKIIFRKAYGHHRFEKNRKVQPDDLYDLASITKISGPLPVLLKLHSEGKFNLDATLGEYLPFFQNSDKAALNFTDLLTHRARMAPWIPYWKDGFKKNGHFKRKAFSWKKKKRYPHQIATGLYLHKNFKKQIYKAIKKSPLLEKKAYKYSGLVFYLFPEIIENRTGQPYESYLYENFYKKLGAHTLCYNPLLFFDKNSIVPTEFDCVFRKELIHGNVHDEGAILMKGVSGNAGLFANANDLVKLMQLFLNEGSYGGERFFNVESMKVFNNCLFCSEGNRRGLGFDKPLVPYHPQNSSTAKDASLSSFGHSGFTGTCVWVDPAEELIFIFLSNRVYPTRDNKKLYRLNIRPEIHQAIYDAIIKKDEIKD